ncbi:MAG TPA: hypothetical protein VI759_00650 [Dehalococcoidia bacterium]|nr:hypothetical protein [Dehalococcoidia bacterium]
MEVSQQTVLIAIGLAFVVIGIMGLAPFALRVRPRTHFDIHIQRAEFMPALAAPEGFLRPALVPSLAGAVEVTPLDEGEAEELMAQIYSIRVTVGELLEDVRTLREEDEPKLKAS